MATKQMNESWQRVRARVRSLWEDTDLGTDKELKKTRGDMQKLINLVHERTGEPRSEIFNKISAVI